MNAKLLRAVCIGYLTAVVTVGAGSALADDNTPAKQKSSSGTITAVDAKEKTVTIKQYLFSKTFHLGDNCAFMLGDRRASLGDFRPGQKVEVSYQDASGVLVANRLAQQKLLFTGEIAAVDATAKTMTVKQRGASKTFALSENCAYLINGSTRGTLDSMKLGGKVTVTYEVPNNELVAHQVEQKSAQFVGTLDAVSLPDRTITAGKRFLGNKKFHLADDCAIIVNGKPEGRLNDLRLGQSYELSYDSVDGVNVVNRIAPAMPEKTDATQASATTAPEQMKSP